MQFGHDPVLPSEFKQSAGEVQGCSHMFDVEGMQTRSPNALLRQRGQSEGFSTVPLHSSSDWHGASHPLEGLHCPNSPCILNTQNGHMDGFPFAPMQSLSELQLSHLKDLGGRQAPYFLPASMIQVGHSTGSPGSPSHSSSLLHLFPQPEDLQRPISFVRSSIKQKGHSV